MKFIEILGLCSLCLPVFNMGRKGTELTSDLTNVVVDMFKNGSSIAEISWKLMKPYSTIRGALNKFKMLGSTENQLRLGQSCLVTKRDYLDLERTVKCNRRDLLVDITNKFNEGRIRKVSKRTAQYHLHKHGFKRPINRKKVVIKAVNRAKSLAWCREKRRWPVLGRLDIVVFSDESQIVIGSIQCVYIWRKREKGYRPDLLPLSVTKVVKVMIWGCICWHHVGTIAKVDGNLNAEKYEHIINDNLWPVVAQHFPNDRYFFQDDNALVHPAGRVNIYKARNNINSISWPAQSPGLNINENLWLFIKRKLSSHVKFINKKQELLIEIHRIWSDILPAYIQNLYNSILQRIINVIRLKGHLSKY